VIAGFKVPDNWGTSYSLTSIFAYAWSTPEGNLAAFMQESSSAGSDSN